MSHLMTALAMQQQGLKPATKIVLYWLADHHNSETGFCFPSLNTLAAECEMGRNTVVSHLEILEEMGLISRNKRVRPNGSQTSTEYFLSIKQPVQKSNSPCSKSAPPPVQNLDPHNLGTNNLVKRDTKVSPKKSTKPRPKARLPDDWVPDEQMISQAKEHGLNENDISEIAHDFQIYWTDAPASKSTKSLEGWRSTWRNNLKRVAWQFTRNRQTNGRAQARGFGQKSSFASVIAQRQIDGQV